MLDVVGADVLYCDTDSIYFKGNHRADFIKVNEELTELAIKAGAYADNLDGKRYYLGTWDEDQQKIRFKTLGAKKYIYETWAYKNGAWEKETHSTIAGVKKSRGQEFFTRYGFEAFKTGTVIENSGHLVAYRNDDRIHKIKVDGCTMTTASNVALVDDTYTIGVTNTYLELLRLLMNNITYFNDEGE